MVSRPFQDTVAATSEDHDDRDELGNSLLSASDHSRPTLSRSQSLSERLDAGSTPGNSLRASKRPKYLRSRFGSQRSSTSSFITNPESHDGSDATVGLSLDYALHSGGAVPALGNSRVSSNVLPRSISVGSMASGFGADDYDAFAQPLESLAEMDTPPPTRHGDLMQTPKASSFHSVPTDTIIAQHVRNVQVPESLAKEYKFKNGLQTPRRPSNLTSGSATAGRSGEEPDPQGAEQHH